MILLSLPLFPRRRLFLRLVLLSSALVFAAATLARADTSPRRFAIPAGAAEKTLRLFATQSGLELLYSTDVATGVRTNAVNGELPPLDALKQLLSGTSLVVAAEGKEGVLRITRDSDPNALGAARTADRARPDGARPAETNPVLMQQMQVTGSRIQQMEMEGFAPLFSYDAQFILNTGFSTTEDFLRSLPQNFTGSIAGRAGVPNDTVPGVRSPGQSGAGLAGLGANNTLVLIDGQRMPLAANGSGSVSPSQGFYDLNTIPLGMIERIEVLTDGASAIYGSDATGGVINIILKKNTNQTEIRARIGGTFHGGAFERGASLTHGFSRGKLTGMIAFDALTRNALFANQRSFSKTADQTARGGSDFRSTVGSPIRVFALAGQTLSGLTNPNGTPATNAIAPAGQNGIGLTPASFAATAGQANNVRYDSTHLQAFINPSDRWSISSNLTYRPTSKVVMNAQVSYDVADTDLLNTPQPTSSANGAAASGFIPAANPFNPFKQNLGFSLLHEEMGPRLNQSQTKFLRSLVSASVELPRAWQAQATAQFASQRLYTANPILNVPLMQAALNQTDPARALNLFADPRFADANAVGIYEAIFPLTIEDSRSDLYTAQVFGRGPLFALPAGEIQAVIGGEWQQQDRIRRTNVPSALLPARSRFTRDTWAEFVEVSVPLVNAQRNARTLAHALDLQLAARNEEIENAGRTLNPKYGVRWQPTKWMLLRGSYGTGFRAPAPSEFEQPESSGNATVTDPVHAQQTSVIVTTGSNRELEAETSETRNFGMMVTVPRVKGLTVGVDYSRKQQENLTASFTAQVIVNNEALFPERVTRAAPTPAQQAAGKPGNIIAVDASYINFGFVEVETLDFTANYALPMDQWGKFTLRVTASHYLKYNLALTPGAATVGDDLVGSSSSFPAETRGNAYVFWTRGNLGGTLICYYNGGFRAGNLDVASSTTFDANFSYLWKRRNIRFQGGIGNIFDREPPFVNTGFGYQTGSLPGPKMRSYTTSVTYTF